MILPDFIIANLQPILKEWDGFTLGTWHGPDARRHILRHHAADVLLAVASHLNSSQDHDKGLGDEGQSRWGQPDGQVDGASGLNALHHLSSGFELPELVAGYQALRACVVRLWIPSLPAAAPGEMHDLLRFDEAIDELLAGSVTTFTRHLDASRECLLGILGHDLRTPLAAANLVAYLLAESNASDPQALQLASALRISLDEMDNLIRDLLDFTGTRLGGRMAVSLRPMDLLPLCREVLAEIKEAHPSHTFIFISPDRGELAGTWDDQRLRRLILNLLDNAVQHGSSHTPVTLTVTATDAEVSLEVHNRGPSIPDKLLNVIFDPMDRRKTSDTNFPVGGIGLGLYIARGVVHAHGGSIDVASTADETVFTVRIPRHFHHC